MQPTDQDGPRWISASRQLLVLALYAVISILLLGRVLFRGFAAFHLGPTVDSSFLMWALAWWPYALRHGLNPFICRLIWAPAGFDLAWSGGIPLVSLIAASLTISAGPVATYNVLCLVAPALAAWCAFSLCYRLGGRYYPALIGGYLFGFSPYMLGQLAGGHLNLLLLFPAPLIVMIVIAGWRRAITPASLVTTLAAAFIVQFLCSIELAATSVIFGTVALLLGWWVADHEARARLRDLIAPLAFAAGVGLVVRRLPQALGIESCRAALDSHFTHQTAPAPNPADCYKSWPWTDADPGDSRPSKISAAVGCSLVPAGMP